MHPPAPTNERMLDQVRHDSLRLESPISRDSASESNRLEAILVLLHLNTFDEKPGKRAWKALPWSVTDQLHDKGYISDPATKAKSVWLSDEGAS
jgi:hypothetical protein